VRDPVSPGLLWAQRSQERRRREAARFHHAAWRRSAAWPLAARAQQAPVILHTDSPQSICACTSAWANPVSMNFDQALVAFQLGKVDGQENPIALIIPYKLWAVHSYNRGASISIRPDQRLPARPPAIVEGLG
jgi:hypothetical protein